MINVLLVDDHELVRAGIRRILEDIKGIKVVGEACCGELARLESITVLPADDKGPVSVTKIIDGAELLIPMAGLINKDDE
ncbi:hypothetical protein MJO10_28920, partial [Salmonella enterica subsp. enterica serovar Anatum]|nr:hypothetical protein [Salmonella enterica subsp. enterica serovar Anatum]